MLRYQFFYFLILLFLFSCEEKKTNDPNIEAIQKEALILRDKAIENFDKQDFNTSFNQFNKSKALYETIKDSANIAYILIKISEIHQRNGDYYGSKEVLTSALPYLRETGDYTASVKTFLGIADKELSLFDDALFYYKKAANEYKDPLFRHGPLQNIAVIYTHQKKI